MTGKALILYILQNNLENTIVLNTDGFFIGFMTEEETAVKFNVGVETVRAWYNCKMMKGTKIGDSLYFHKEVADPRSTIKIEMGYEQ